MTQEKVALALLVENNTGVLARVAMMFGRRGYNIDSLTVSETNDPGISRITIATHGEEKIIDQIVLQTKKLIEVRSIRVEDTSAAIQRELLLAKLRTTENQRSHIKEICEIYEAKIVDLTRDSLIVELTGKPGKIDAFLDVLSPYDIIEQCRTGMTTIGRGSAVMPYDHTENHRA
ncbi:acetolactate synthase small subunit [Oscillibacter sp. MSJ-2]|uniref:Acetolactate synthase small subunit n=1 Tax=Dysosmobacter acutus TaxID=2841504 RepID=A0ABS6F5P9_9FIRM|nr:acetolactate synthase small subunit [Dysosmobacter acutus]MBU5625623.1 acetolactate synthase small subunit [Dysosmobacter acutus]